MNTDYTLLNDFLGRLYMIIPRKLTCITERFSWTFVHDHSKKADLHYWTVFLDVCTWSFQEGHRYSRRLPGTMVRCKHCSRTILHLTSFCGQIKTLFLIFKWVKKITFIQFLIFFTKTLVTKIFQDASCFQIAIYLKAHQSSNHITAELETLLHVYKFFQMHYNMY